MANKRMIDATVASTLSGTEPTWVWQGGVLCQSTTGAVAALGGGGGSGGNHLFYGSGVPSGITTMITNDAYFDTSGTGNVYKYNGSAWVVSFNILGPAGSSTYRVASTTTDTPTSTDASGTIEYTNASAITVNVNWLGAGVTYNIIQTGNGIPTLTAGSGVTLSSANASPSYQPASKGGMLNVYCSATSNSVIVNGRMI